MADKEIIVDGLGCNNCPEIGRCREQQERKDTIISTLLYSLLDTDNERIISNLKELIPKITRCDVVLEKQLKRAEEEINGYKTIIEKIRQEVQEDVTCESRECGCDSHEECIECLKNTILNIIDEERNDFVL